MDVRVKYIFTLTFFRPRHEERVRICLRQEATVVGLGEIMSSCYRSVARSAVDIRVWVASFSPFFPQ
jgi:hypothetical protein